MSLTPHQRRRVAWLKDGHLDNDDFDSPEFQARWHLHFAAISSPQELYLFASEEHPATQPYEWRRVLDHPLCDAGTALLVLWRNSPVHHFGDEPPGGWERDRYDLVREIATKYTAGEYPSAVVRFDPAAFKNTNFLARHTPDELARLPGILLKPSPGEPVRPLGDEDFDWSDEGF
jgi:hypothetical protein